ncbi:copper oxidase [Nocardioides sp. Root122]|uniref:multicopper oxidase domain-containing protein n=1 Tax=Nocardioides TaxID=1839 RepID=UPI00070392AC|nr:MULTISPECIES: multicopper oxidase domain-containing protein [Nocardioides]KQV77888.1 copper oxidase [Nocardioides sp. Root122]MCK9822370.1 multicopper oxidase domain-containing protein [Nocardioides cavernae]
MTTLQSPSATRPDGPTAGTRGFWPLRDLPVVGWLMAAVVVALVHQWVPEPRWLLLHLLLLGAAGHSILVWSRYFADTLLRGPATPRREQSIRLAVFDLGAVAVTVGVGSDVWLLVLVGATGVALAVVGHVVSLARGLRGRFRSRFAPTVHYYLAAGALLPVGATLGVWLARGLSDPLDARVRIAHAGINVLGWVGLTVLGTLVTLWPTMLRTRLAEGAEKASRVALPVLVTGIGLVAAAAWADQPRAVAVGLVTYLVGVSVLVRPMVAAARAKPPASFPTWSVGAGVLWIVVMLAVVAVRVAVGGGWDDVSRALHEAAPYLAAGFVAQVLLGALSYLVPVVLGGGPVAVRAANGALDSAGALRVALANVGLVWCLLPVPSVVRVVASVLVLGALASFVPLLLLAVRLRHRGTAGSAPVVRPRGQNTGLAAVGVALAVLAVAVGGAVDPAALGRTSSADAGVAPTGHTVEVEVVAKEMRFTPDRVEVAAGDRLVITLRNESSGDVHDLVLETGADTGRIAPGEEAVLDVGVVGRDLDGWCSVVGHRQMGMVFAVDVTGGNSASSAQPAQPAEPEGHEHHGHDASGAPLNAPGDPGPGFSAYDPVLPPLAPGRVHRYTFRVTEQQAEVAPGVTQEVWTFNGTAPGPVLHGRVGDRFVITLVNDGTMGHSIDFHAGVRAPDEVMRTIPPGESLTYRFTARRAGVWMYHCSTMPMTAHIANGLFGAVVIDPPGLPPVDREYVLVQSEQYHGADGAVADLDKVAAEDPDAVVFNGYPDQYAHRPLRARTGDRVRIWVLDAGPSRASSFHVVGGQFDTVYSEGAWQLGSRSGPARDAGAQVLPLVPAQGGFVELELDEPGDYPFVSHVMVDAERGARGVLQVRR